MKNSGLFANRNKYGDFVKTILDELSNDSANVNIAVAFFTEADVVESMLAKGCHVRMIVRLGFPTNPKALKKLMDAGKVEIRYFSAYSFHPKIYLFGDHTALVGSANLTNSAILTNQEVVISIESEDQRFNELVELFTDYWEQANVLNTAVLNDYAAIYAEYERLENSVGKLETKVFDKLGRTSPNNITRDKVKVSKENLFIEDFRKTYQEGVSAFNIIRQAYVSTGYRKASSERIPLRIEIDSFISYVRNKHAVKESWAQTPFRSGEAQVKFIVHHIDQWRNTAWPHFEQTIVGVNYPLLLKTLGSAEAIQAADVDALFDALAVLHSFYDRLRFNQGELSTWRHLFLNANKSEKLRESLTYLLFGADDIEIRMANMIFNPDYKLREFGKSNVQELIGWVNKEELPILNERTMKILRFFGSNVKQFRDKAP